MILFIRGQRIISYEDLKSTTMEMRLPQAGICRGTWFGTPRNLTALKHTDWKWNWKTCLWKKTIDFIFKYPLENLYGGPDVAPLRQSGCWPERQHSIPSVTTEKDGSFRFTAKYQIQKPSSLLGDGFFFIIYLFRNQIFFTSRVS